MFVKKCVKIAEIHCNKKLNFFIQFRNIEKNLRSLVQKAPAFPKFSFYRTKFGDFRMPIRRSPSARHSARPFEKSPKGKLSNCMTLKPTARLGLVKFLHYSVASSRWHRGSFHSWHSDATLGMKFASAEKFTANAVAMQPRSPLPASLPLA